ncbi:MAG: septal ring lytic transglycosylase RlpA family protein [Desulfobulbaceae bacterium]|nr:MAG: septal ring lytic transglycosylase RlpA family protein [Desulfobulbaceae bacterium]
MISCTTTTDSSRSNSGVQDDTTSTGAASLHRLSFIAVLLLILIACPTGFSSASYDRGVVSQDPYTTGSDTRKTGSPVEAYSETGLASWYGQSFHGKRTSSGERFDMHAMTAAHKELPMNTVLKVKNLENGKEAVVRVNDRGPYAGKRIIDLSQSAAKALKLAKKGTAKVEITVLSEPGSDHPSAFDGGPGSFKATDQFYIQVGAFSRKHYAEKMQKRFEKSGYDVEVLQVIGRKSTIYKVLVAAGTTRDKAVVTERKIKNNGYNKAFVIAR